MAINPNNKQQNPFFVFYGNNYYLFMQQYYTCILSRFKILVKVKPTRFHVRMVRDEIAGYGMPKFYISM